MGDAAPKIPEGMAVPLVSSRVQGLVKSLRGGAVVPPGEVRIDRKTPWGNPFTMKSEAERASVIERYRTWLWEEIRSGRIPLEHLAALEGKTLWCWCAPLPCHGHVLAAAALWAAEELRRR